jgi:hypothetical protein
MNMVQAEALRRNMPFLHVINLPPSTVDIASGHPTAKCATVAAGASILHMLLSMNDRNGEVSEPWPTDSFRPSPVSPCYVSI